MQKWLENKFTNCLNFEHTIFLSEAVIEFLLNKHKLKIINKFYFKEHSIFYAVSKDESIDTQTIQAPNEYTKNKKLYENMQKFYTAKIAELNEILKISKQEIYLFGAHLFSQYLLYHGLKSDTIKAILDNNINKQGKRLYGTSLFVQSPKILKDKDNALLILNAGAYNEEIKKDILENINNKIQIISF
ncbi:hypothetical protein [Campylobacter sp. MIT 97-5078]|uniref:hypothetical protein n=1 Tax=Campylobacter sp. MIT 97-5078 TaxID=1548153 RepID=UPI000A937FA1|nr:hypothetical protein [Campylobacter sp. MIT 97-5078]